MKALKANLVNHHLTQEQVMEAALRKANTMSKNTSSEIKSSRPPCRCVWIQKLNPQVFA